MSLATITGQPVFARRRFITILGLLAASTLAFAPRADAGFIGYYDINTGSWVLSNNPSGNGTATTPDSGNSLVVTGSQTGTGNPTATDFLIIAPSAGTVMFSFTYTSPDTVFPLCGGDLMQSCDDGGYVINGVYTQLANALTQVTTPTTVSFSVNAGDSFGFQVDAVDNTGEPGVLTISNFSAPLNAPEPGTAGMLALAAAAAFGVRRRMKTSQL